MLGLLSFLNFSYTSKRFIDLTDQTNPKNNKKKSKKGKDVMKKQNFHRKILKKTKPR